MKRGLLFWISFILVFLLWQTTHAQTLKVTVTQVTCNYGYLKTYGTIENDGWSDIRKYDLFLQVWHGRSLIIKKRIYPEEQVIKSSYRVGWWTICKIPEYVGSNYEWEIVAEGCKYEVRYAY